MKILVTGGAGYVGSVLVERFVKRGYGVTVLDNFMYGQTPLGHLCRSRLFNIVRGDARDSRILRHLLKGVDIFIPLAALVGAPLCEALYQDAYDINANAIQTAIGLMSREQRILIPITNSGYGIGESGKECTEESTLSPISVYGQTKVLAESIVMKRGNAISFRLATVFGMSPRMRLDLLVNDFVWRAIRDRSIVLFEPHFKRNYIHIQDVAHVFCHGINNFDSMKDQVYNVGLSDANLSKQELCEWIRKHVPDLEILVSEHGKDPDKRDYVVSNAKIEATGFKPWYSLDDGIAELMKGYQMLKRTEHGNV